VPHQQADVAGSDVVEVAHGHQVDDDAEQPGSHDESADRGADRHQDPGQDLDDPDDQHRLVGRAGHAGVDPRRA
jgi:hypothetical protein